MPTVDLFCGCGGLSMGFENAGFDIVAAFDSWGSARLCYNYNFEHEASNLDLNNVEESIRVIAEHHPTLIIGGPPCQEFSNAGRREEGPRADLTYKFAQIVTSILPRFFVMENVPRVRYSNAYAKARELYANAGYGLTEIVLDASKCGVPQKRNRFFCIGGHGLDDDFLLETIFEGYINDPISVHDYFANNGYELNIEAYYRHPTTYDRRAVFSVDDPAPTVRGVNRPKPETYQRHPNDAVDEENLQYVRNLSIEERAIIQTFPPDYHFDGLGISNSELEQIIGNAVPVILATYVAGCLHDYMEDAQMNANERFASWLRRERNYTDRSISDVFSRINRARQWLPNHDFNKYFITDLEDVPQFGALTNDVRSQIRKAIRLKLAFAEQQ